MQTAVAGTGPDVVLLHGWGMRASVWVELAAADSELPGAQR